MCIRDRSTNTAYAGTFSLTFQASDGVNIATAASSFTLQFQIPNQRYTTALITSVGANNAVNNSFDDKSTSDHTITTVGDVHQTTFSPYRHGGYSMEFDGTGDFIDTPNHADFDLDGEFTIEFWVYIPGSYARTVQRVIAPNSSGYGTAPYISIGNDAGITGGPAMSGVLCATRAVGAGNPQMHANQTGTSATGTAILIPLNTWTHCALTRDSSNVCRLFQGGTLVATNKDTNDFDFKSEFPFNDIYLWLEQNSCEECIEYVVSIMMEPYNDITEPLVSNMSSEEERYFNIPTNRTVQDLSLIHI